MYLYVLVRMRVRVSVRSHAGVHARTAWACVVWLRDLVSAKPLCIPVGHSARRPSHLAFAALLFGPPPCKLRLCNGKTAARVLWVDSCALVAAPEPFSCPAPTTVSAIDYLEVAVTAGAEYPEDMTCLLTVHAPFGPDAILRLYFESFSLEWGYDLLTIYDGASASAPILGVFSDDELEGQDIAGTSGIGRYFGGVDTFP